MCCWAKILKNFCHIWIQLPPISLIAEFCRNRKMLKCGTKNELFGYSCRNISEKPLSYLQSAPSNLPYCKVLYKKKKVLRFGSKNANFGARIVKHYCHIWNQRPRICLLTKFDANTKIFKFGTKISWVVYFWAESWKIFCDIWYQYPQICLTAKFLEKT